MQLIVYHIAEFISVNPRFKRLLIFRLEQNVLSVFFGNIRNFYSVYGYFIQQNFYAVLMLALIAGEFGKNDMLPKMEAALSYLTKVPTGSVLITSIDKAAQAIKGKAGTLITV